MVTDQSPPQKSLKLVSISTLQTGFRQMRCTGLDHLSGLFTMPGPQSLTNGEYDGRLAQVVRPRNLYELALHLT